MNLGKAPQSGEAVIPRLKVAQLKVQKALLPAALQGADVYDVGQLACSFVCSQICLSRHFPQRSIRNTG